MVQSLADRVIAAFEVDRRLPRVAKPKETGNSHPTIFRDADERAEVEEARKLVGIEDDPAPIRPSSEEIAAMEATFKLLPPLAEHHRPEYDALRFWAARMAGGTRSLRSIAKELGTSAMTLLRRKDRALAYLASQL